MLDFVELVGGPFDGETVAWPATRNDVAWYAIRTIPIDLGDSTRRDEATVAFRYDRVIDRRRNAYRYQRTATSYGRLAHFRDTELQESR